MALIGLPVLGEVRTIKLPGDPEEIALDEVDKKKLKTLIKALFDLKSSKKSKYASWARHLINGMGAGSNTELKPYWPS